MKVFHNKNLLQKICITILIILSMNFIIPTYSHAEFWEDVNENGGGILGGVLGDPIADFICSVGDVVLNTVQKAMTGNWGSTDSDEFFGGLRLNNLNWFMIDADKYAERQEAIEGVTSGGKNVNSGEEIDPNEEFDKGWFGTKKMYKVPVIIYSPEQIFSGDVPGLDINFIGSDNTNSASGVLQKTVAAWYVVLRNIAIVGLLLILVYVGIRIIISSTAPEKAKYKQFLTDWLVALCLVFVLHYIMYFTIIVTESISDALSPNGASSVTIKIKDDENNLDHITTNLLGEVRFKTQYNNFLQKFTYVGLYLILVGFTVYFTFVYLKRLIMMAFLTIIAPLVALTYPIDKISDGQAQAFNSWLKEYVYNALIQPFHLVLYFVLVTSAINLVETNKIYAIVALFFITKGEQLLRQFFGFNKAPSLGNTMAGFAGGAMASKLFGSHGKGKGASSNTKNADKNDKIRFEKNPDVGSIDTSQGGYQETSTTEETEEKQKLQDDEKQEKDGANDHTVSGGKGASGAEPKTGPQYKATKKADGNSGGNGTSDEDQKGSGDGNGSPKDDDKKKNKPLTNWKNAHGGGLKMGKRVIKGIAKTGSKVAFTAAGGTIGAIAGVATGNGLAGMVAGATGGAAVGSNLANRVNNAHPIRTINNVRDRIGKELDIANGNTYHQDQAAFREFSKDEDNRQYVIDQMTAENNGQAPSAKEVNKRMKEYQPYVAQGVTDLKQISKANKVVEKYGIKKEQSATIAALGKNLGITKDTLSDEKSLKSAQTKLVGTFSNAARTDEEKAQAEQKAKYTLEVLKAQNGLKNNFKPIQKA